MNNWMYICSCSKKDGRCKDCRRIYPGVISDAGRVYMYCPARDTNVVLIKKDIPQLF